MVFWKHAICHYNCLKRYCYISGADWLCDYAEAVTEAVFENCNGIQNDKKIYVRMGLGCTLPGFCAVYKLCPPEVQIPSEDGPQIYLQHYAGEYTEQIQEMFSAAIRESPLRIWKKSVILRRETKNDK